jgi:hypothetical protein
MSADISQAGLAAFASLSTFLENVRTNFKLRVVGGIYLAMGNSGQRGGTKWFNLGLSELIICLKDIRTHLPEIASANTYNESRWREFAAKHFTQGPAKDLVAVQTLTFFTLLAKIIHWAIGEDPSTYADGTIDLTPRAVDIAIDRLSAIDVDFAPQENAVAHSPQPLAPQALTPSIATDIRLSFLAALDTAHFMSSRQGEL